ncbi:MULTISPECIES: M20 family metallopeptidase [unclassified Microbacterium]|uniref:M20 family metallopeptidase n=1 Tax=unclassified Microbacterium TaxID=2609290 RepID=UPI001D39C5E2|nr:M20 family metallopeptidase [Microbacterium sp. USTB-Y]MBS1896741.1 M20 family metallopeptidase [Actinomycetota bacterium]MBS1899027.1 M20 family metallopeptidase [Actinomycetota bacterium]
MRETGALKDAADAVVAAASADLIRLSEALHADPETAWQEHRSAARVAEALAAGGFRLTPGYLGLPTAFLAEAGSGPTVIGIMAEYDALPGLGHACGHNLIAASAVGAGLALAPLADELGLTVRVYGTPAEEGGGGKIELIEAGAFRDLALALMVHPAPVDVAEARPFAVSHSHIAYDGVSAHAAAYPDQGVNANDAFLVAQVAIGLLRQQLPADTRVHGVQTVGGYAPNAIPERTEGRWYVRANSLAELEVLEARVNRCFEAGALASGATLRITPESKPYAEFRTDERALAAYRRNALARGRVFADPAVAGRMNRASTDMGNVSQLVPAIHPYIGVGSLPYGNHQKEFAAACVGPVAEQALRDAAVLMAWTVIDVFAPDPRASDTPAGRGAEDRPHDRDSDDPQHDQTTLKESAA